MCQMGNSRAKPPSELFLRVSVDKREVGRLAVSRQHSFRFRQYDRKPQSFGSLAKILRTRSCFFFSRMVPYIKELRRRFLQDESTARLLLLLVG